MCELFLKDLILRSKPPIPFLNFKDLLLDLPRQTACGQSSSQLTERCQLIAEGTSEWKLT
jgi:hypothetical protein